jgi:SAM-dependent methyltransferase
MSFDSVYARAYDRLYQDKAYDLETGIIEEAFSNAADGPVRQVLDLGCGTGSHAALLAERGYEVTGVDRSEAMLAIARNKAVRPSTGGRLSFRQGDLRDTRLRRRFDAVLMMFAVLGYQLENDDVLAALATAREHLRKGGLFIFDIWYGPAVLTQRPGPRVKTLTDGDVEIVRASDGSLDTRSHTCTVDYRLWLFGGTGLVDRSTERHVMRYYFPRELEHFLSSCGLELVRLSAFPETAREPDETTWNVLAVARAS